MKNLLIYVILLSSIQSLKATHKVYLIHGYGGLGLELFKVKGKITKAGYTCETFYYNSISQDIKDVSQKLYLKIKSDNYDTISFVTHSMGGLIVRSLTTNIDQDKNFPFIHRTVMIAPPNLGSNIADYFSKKKFIKCLIGPNVVNLSTDHIVGAKKYPSPKGELGVIAGNINRKRYLHLPLENENDGIVLVKNTCLDIEKDCKLVKAGHIGILLKKETASHVINFLNQGHF